MCTTLPSSSSVLGFFTQDEIHSILQESLKIKQFNHPNILSLIGMCFDSGPAPYIVMPYMAKGSLLTYLRKNRYELVLPDESNEETVSLVMDYIIIRDGNRQKYVHRKKDPEPKIQLVF